MNESKEWKLLEEHAVEMKDMHLKELLKDEERSASMITEFDSIYYDYSRVNGNGNTMDLLFDLAEAANLRKKLADMAGGQHLNSTENRAVLHMALRAPSNKCFMDKEDGKNVVLDVHRVLEHIKGFSKEIRKGDKVGATGKAFKNVISIGIGGSYLGPEFVFEALRNDKDGAVQSKNRTLRFLANVDPVDAARSMEGLDPEETLVIVVSKTFTTAETILNAKTVREWLVNGMKNENSNKVVEHHMVAVSAAVQKAQEFGIHQDNVFGFWDWVGGRYSVCSAVGILPLALQYGFEMMQQFLAGAHSMDMHVLDAPLRTNIPVIMGLIGVWNASFLGHHTRALLPYSQALLRFSAHIQQVDMESNGKRVGVDGKVLPYTTGEINFGEPGTNGQHSFYQLIHQGRIVPCDFIGFRKSQHPISIKDEAVSNHDELMSNFFAQPDALANGKSIDDLKKEGVAEELLPHKMFPGNRPSTSLMFEELNAYTTGQLLAMYEHRTVVQGFIWGVNSFDQWGVELGKVLAKKVRAQLSSSRGDAATPLEGFNPSTTSMLKRYLQ